MSSITVYTKPACPQCDATKRHLTKKGVEFETVDLTVDTEARDLVTSLGYMSAPVVKSGDAHFSGFRPDRLDKTAACISRRRRFCFPMMLSWTERLLERRTNR
jgi:glutaredoxin-like protein NrdH